MPFVPKYTPKELVTILTAMQEYPPEKVVADYAVGEITLKEKLLRLQLYGDAQREAQIRSDIADVKAKSDTVKQLGGEGYVGSAVGELKYFAQGVMQEFKAAWDNAEDKPAEAVFHGIMGGLKLLGAADVPGDVAERWALELFPESPGFARAVNWGVWIPSNLLGLSAVLKAPLKAAGATLRTGAKATGFVKDYAKFIKDPVEYVVKATKTQDALMASKLATTQAANTVSKGAGVAGAAASAEAKGGMQAFKTAAPQAQQTLYHGTPVGFSEFDIGKAQPGLYGKGIYLTDNADVASGYANPAGRVAELPADTIKSLERQIADPKTNPADKAKLQDILSGGQQSPNVRPVYANVAKPFNMEAKLTPEESQKIYDIIGQSPQFKKHVSGPSNESNVTGQDMYDFIESLYGKDGTTEVLKKAGYDAITHEGGKITSGTQHQVTIVFDPKQVTPKFTPENFPISTPQELEKMTVTELIKHYEQRAIDMIRSKSAGGPGVSHKQTQAAASASPISFDDIVARGPDAPISATELEAIGRVHKQVSDAFNNVVDEASKHIGDISAGQRPDLVQAYKAHLAAMEVTNPAFLSGRGQAGRGLEYLKTMQDLVAESRVFDVLTRSLSSEKLLESSDAAIAYTIQKVAALAKDQRALLVKEASGDVYNPGTVRLFYKSLLFARPGIHVANTLGNVSSIMLNGVNKSVASVMPWSEVTTREAAAYWSGMWDARNKFGEIWKAASENQSRSLSKAGIEGTATGAMVEKGPLGWLGFEDEFMSGVVQHGLAKAEAIKEGLSKWDELQAAAKAGMFDMPSTGKKKWLGEFLDSAMNDPKNYERLLTGTEKEADYILFHSPLSRGGEYIAKGIRETVFDYYAPVVKFPLSSIKMARDWTPGLQMLSKDFVAAVMEGGARADAARARMTLSWMISSQVWEGAKAGIIVGDGPTNPQANAVWRAAGNTPRSIHGVPIQWAEPFATWFSFIADLAHNSSEMTDDNVSNAFQAVMMSGYQAIENNYFLRIADAVTNSMSDIKAVKDLNDILGVGAKTVLQPIKTIFPMFGTVGRVGGEMVNPQSPDLKMYGELKDLKNWFFAGTPFGTDTRPRLNYSGKTVMVPPMLGSNWLKENLGFPDWAARGVTALLEPSMRQNIGSDDPVAQFLAKHELTLHDNWKYYGGSGDLESPLPITSPKPRVNLTGDQAFNWKKVALNDVREYGTNRSWTEAVAALDSDPEFNKQNKYEKQQEVNRLYGEFRADGLDELKKLDPDIVRKEAERDAFAERQPAPGADTGPTAGPGPGGQPLRLDIEKSISELNAGAQ